MCRQLRRDPLGAVVRRPDAEEDPDHAGILLGPHRGHRIGEVGRLVADRHHDVDVGPSGLGRPGVSVVHGAHTRRLSTTQTVRMRICTSITIDQLTRYCRS